MTGAGDDSSPKTKQSPSEFAHPETGEVLLTREEFQSAFARIEKAMAPWYRERRRLQQEYADRFEAAVLPDRRSRTPTQDRVARCPRCGVKLESEEAAS